MKKIFKYENKNRKKLRVRDLLMIFSAFCLCVAAILGSKSYNKDDKNISVQTKLVSSDAHKSDVIELEGETTVKAQLSDYGSEPVHQISSDAVELKFEKPVDGYVIKPFSANELIYSETMDDWRIHLGVDISCPLGSEIKAVERGIVKSNYYDINLGNTVVVESEDFIISYCSLSSESYVQEGQVLAKGDIIGKSSDTCMSELCDEPHIHFEMSKDGKNINPLDYIEFN